MFQLIGNDPSSKARRGRLTTSRGVIETPAYMPVGTQGSVKAVSSRELYELEAQIVLGNTYHLFVRPGREWRFGLRAKRGRNHHTPTLRFQPICATANWELGPHQPRRDALESASRTSSTSSKMAVACASSVKINCTVR